MKTVLVAPNSFKGCATSVEIANILANKLSELLPSEKFMIISTPLSDGGDGFLEVLAQLYPAKITKISISNDKCSGTVPVQIGETDSGYIIESAKIIGLGSKVPTLNEPLNSSSRAMGEVIRIISGKNSNNREIIIGTGGTATVDMGIGMLSALGLKLLDAKGNILEPVPRNFINVKKIIPPDFPISAPLKFVLDVDNMLIGENGGVRVYGPQKGLDESGITQIEKGFRNILEILGLNSVKFLPGAGGGLGAIINQFYKVEYLQSGDFIKNKLLSKINLGEIDYLVTGEGKIDKQTFMQKAPGIICESGKKRNIPVFMFCGISEYNNADSDSLITIIEISKYFNKFKDSLRYYKKGLESGVEELVKIIT